MGNTSIARVFFSLVIFLGLHMPLQAQFNLALELGLALPVNNVNGQLQTGFGGQLSGRYFTSPQFALGLGIGYYTFDIGEGNNANNQTTFNITPVTAIIEYYIGDDYFRVILGLEAGFYRVARRFTINNFTTVDGRSEVGGAPKLGLSLNVAPNLHALANLKYHFINSSFQNSDFLAVNFGFAYEW